MKNFAAAYGAKRKKMANGGSVKSEKRPMPDDKHNDAMMTDQNEGKKPIVGGDWDQNKSIPRPKTQPIKHPSMAQSPVFKVKLRDQEDDLESSDAPASPKEQPPKADNEVDAKKSGPSVPALHMKKMAKGGKINDFEPMEAAEADKAEHPAGLESDNDEMSPSKDEFMAGHFAEGGIADEEAEEHHNSIAAAIMAKRDRMHAMIDSGALDEDEAVHGYADGGEVDLAINHKEEPNNEDQMSFQALKKENYNSSNLDVENPSDSAQQGDSREDEEENKLDMISRIRSKMNKDRQFPK